MVKMLIKYLGENMTVLVLGGAGYAGSHAVDMLLKSGYDVAVVDSLVTGHRKAIPENVRFYHGDVRDHNFLAGVFEKENIEGIMHFCVYAKVVLETMEEFGVKNIVFSNTAATYGIPEKSPILEKIYTSKTN